jgi:hypothetical protein
MDIQDQRRDSADVVNAAQLWVARFGTTPLLPADAADLVVSALAVTDAVAKAARQLAWQTPDTFNHVLRLSEQADDC